MANDRRGAAFLRVFAHKGERRLDVEMAEAFQFDDQGRLREFWAHATDQYAIDRFWGEGGDGTKAQKLSEAMSVKDAIPEIGGSDISSPLSTGHWSLI